MALDPNLAAFKSEQQIWLRALTEEILVIPLPEKDARRLRLRLYHVRKLLARDSLSALSPGDPDRGTTPYDGIMICLVPEGLLIKPDPIHINNLQFNLPSLET